jgi:hypothetical protein
MGEPSGGEPINWNQRTQIAVPAPATETRVAIRRLDWARIRRNLLRCTEPQSTLSVWYSICFGIAGSAGFSIIPIGATKDLPAWVWPLYICVTVASGFLGLVLVWLDRRLNQHRRSQIADLAADMDEIERTFDAQGGPTTEDVV